MQSKSRDAERKSRCRVKVEIHSESRDAAISPAGRSPTPALPPANRQLFEVSPAPSQREPPLLEIMAPAVQPAIQPEARPVRLRKAPDRLNL